MVEDGFYEKRGIINYDKNDTIFFQYKGVDERIIKLKEMPTGFNKTYFILLESDNNTIIYNGESYKRTSILKKESQNKIIDLLKRK